MPPEPILASMRYEPSVFSCIGGIWPTHSNPMLPLRNAAFPRDSFPGPTASLPHPASVLGNHRLSRLASECLLEGSRILHRAIHAPPTRRVRIGQHPLPRLLIRHVLAPDLPVRKEEPLRRRISIDRFHGHVADHVHQNHVGELQASVVRGVF